MSALNRRDMLAGLHGLIDQLPDVEWTDDRRRDFIDAFIGVLDFTIPSVSVLVDSPRGETP